MTSLLRAYFWVGLLLMALLSVFSYGYGVGYVYIYLRHWQIESNIWVLMIGLLCLSFVLQVLWLGLKRYLSKRMRKEQQILSFEQLHPYEKLAVLKVLEAGHEQEKMLQELYQPSVLFKEIVQANMLWRAGHSQQALDILAHSSTLAFELAAFLRIEIYLSQMQGQQALSHLEFLSQHDLSPWLQDLQQGYEHKLTQLWGAFATQFPWLYLYASQFGQLHAEDKTHWLQQILSQYDQASVEDLEALQQCYHQLVYVQHVNMARENKILWLKILARMPEMGREHTLLAEDLLDELFDQEVFYLWFETQLLKQQPDYLEIEQHVNAWEQKYNQLPIFAFAKWHVYQATHRIAESEALLSLYPDNVLMSYLRIKIQLQGNEELSEQLNLLFESNSNYLKINI
ncbi:heme biosynthesis protein HemY [Acinetobacter sp. MD2(2019)]|uniref:heme biosynthesis protein HemY n=1 Tax=Acinetobacter sp. MD2(2019) TaxID=2605273 RepID=UPI002D1ED2D3|nr:heme biosynthesis protein HemY [Acinetobacter sp. MD2(2019)]MEB3754462.1 heme biosynthesis protein HemY [Acinetobacter sp. MD2(2019)]